MSPGRRIIPARAGFTPAPSPPTTACADHPRSRGVYGARAAARTRLDGSSPLARGLPWTARQRAVLAGIIPARAGFTPTNCPPPAVRPDHPRSRGVYNGTCTFVAFEAWIIPARAGFTYGSPGGRTIARDHPRSRGVYDGRANIWAY